MRLIKLCITLLIMNVIDAALTLALIGMGLATEANPLMARALEYGIPAFLVSKLVLVAMGAYTLYRARAIKALLFCNGIYFGLMIVHIKSLLLILNSV